MKPYMAYAGDPQDGAVLVFAHNVKEAKRLSFSAVKSWCSDIEYTDLRVKWLKKHNWLFDDADHDLLKADIPHCNDDPTCCKECELWGSELKDGICEDCRTQWQNSGAV